MPPSDVDRLRNARDELATSRQRGTELEHELATAERELASIDAVGAAAARRRAVEVRLQKLRERRARFVSENGRLNSTIKGLRGALRRASPELSLQQLGGGTPVALLPVRIETRYGDNNTSLKIRIYPEQIHVDQHEPELTADELALAKAYWQRRWQAGSDPSGAKAAWTALAGAVRPPRARHIILATTPANLGELGTGEPELPEVPMRPAPWTRAARARLLPDQWVAIGYVGGKEVFRRWSEPIDQNLALGLAPVADDPAEEGELADEQDTLPIDDGMRWMIEYQAALDAGMAITVVDADLAGTTLAVGLDELVVLGVDWTLAPEAAAAELSDQLARHSVSDGLALLASGTPTNNTAEERAASGTDPRLDIAAIDPGDVNPKVDAAAGAIARAFGFAPNSTLSSVAGNGGLDEAGAEDMNNALWSPTLGYFLEQFARPLMSSADTDRLAHHFRRYVRGRGPLAALRVGKQPYGILPVIAGEFRSGDSFEQGLANRIASLRPFWASAEGSVPKLGMSNRPDADLVELLRRTPRSASFRFREAVGAATASSLMSFELGSMFQEQLARMMLTLTGISGIPEIARITLSPSQRRVPVPLITRGQLSETEQLEPNYIRDVLNETRMAGGLRRLMAKPGDSAALLEALLRQAASLEYLIAATGLVIEHELEVGVLERAPAIHVLREDETPDLTRRERTLESASTLEKVSTAVELADLRISQVSGQRSLVDFVATRIDADLFNRRSTARFAAFRKSLAGLAELPTAELGRLAADTLDCVSHRLDAWATSLATCRLDQLRTGGTQGCHVGIWGYVERLSPRSAPTSLGYLQAPSIAHATTAALLRSAHLARGAEGSGQLAVDLSSKRVSLALELVDGCRQGQPIGALLGYRFERGLRDRRLTLAQYILPFRQAVPLATVDDGAADGQPTEAIAARDVVDGLALLKLWKADAATLFASLSNPVTAADAPDVNAELRALDDLLDSVSDLMLAESVHQTVLGNAERGGAALDALDRQTQFPEIAVVRTPRTGLGSNHRLLLLFQSATPAPGWATLKDSRQLAEPRIDAWSGRQLGKPARYRFAAEVHDEDGTVVQRLSAQLADLGLSAIGVVCGCAAGGAGSASELEERLALHFASKITATNAAKLVLSDDPPTGAPAGSVGLRDLLELGAQLLDLLASARHADHRALGQEAAAEPESAGAAEAGLDASELRERADDAVERFAKAVDTLEAVPVDTTSERMVEVLLDLASNGMRAAVPLTPDVEELSRQAGALVERARRRLTLLQKMEEGLDRGRADTAAQVAHDLARIREIYGAGFPVVALFTTDQAAELSASVKDPALLGDDKLAAAAWLGRYAHVRPAVARMVGALDAAEMLAGTNGLESLLVAQLPHRPGNAWLGLPHSAAMRPAATISIVAHASEPVDFKRSLAGLVIDQWSDVVPREQETTGLSFHFDAPGARAPQSLLIAVPGNVDAPHWTVESLSSTIREAIDLARIRPLDVDDLDAIGRFIPAIYLPFNLQSKTPSINLGQMIGTAILAENAAFAGEE